MPAEDAFEHNTEGLSSPLSQAFAVTPHDTDELAHITRELYVGTGGDLTIVLKGGDEISLVGVPAGARLPYRAKQVKATGTAASNIVGLY